MNCSLVSRLLLSAPAPAMFPKTRCRHVSTYLILRPLRHQLRPLLLDNHLLLAVRQRPRDTQQQRGGRHDPQRLAAKQQPALCPGGECLVLGADAAACGGGDYVFECADALEEGFVGNEGGFGFEVGLCGLSVSILACGIHPRSWFGV